MKPALGIKLMIVNHEPCLSYEVEVKKQERIKTESFEELNQSVCFIVWGNVAVKTQGWYPGESDSKSVVNPYSDIKLCDTDVCRRTWYWDSPFNLLIQYVFIIVSQVWTNHNIQNSSWSNNTSLSLTWIRIKGRNTSNVTATWFT